MIILNEKLTIFAEDGSKYPNITVAAKEVLAKEGFFAFWTGFTAYYARTAPHVMITLIVAEPMTQMYRKLFVNKK